ncbi:AB-hydrolase YheT [Martensiomyces pterosporus]|nr:AB-hydrolase YheT [Martensiomyces pterosporus]
MSGIEVPVAGTAALGLGLAYGIKKYNDGCRVSLITADKDASRVVGETEDGDAVTIRSLLDSECPSLTDPKKAYMVPTPYLAAGVLQTAYITINGFKRDRLSNIKYDRELRIMSDNGTVSLDWYPKRSQDPAASSPIVVVMSGLGGSSDEYHIRCMAKALADGPLKYRVVVMNHRGSGRTPLTSPRVYNGYDTEDYRTTVAYVRSCYPQAPLLGLAFSLGGNVMTKYIGEEGDNCPFVAAAAICCQFDVGIAGRVLDEHTFLNDKIFQPNLMATVKRLVKRNEAMIQSGEIKYDMEKILATKRMKDFDQHFVAKSFGFSSCWEYYDATSSSPYVDKIAIPFLAINTLDDPTIPVRAVPIEKLKRNPNTSLVLVKHGGHLGFFSGLSPRIWYTKPVVEYFDAILKASKSGRSLQAAGKQGSGVRVVAGSAAKL